MSPKLRRAASFLTQRPEMVVLSPLRELAEQAGVSPATLLRLARELGYDSFDALRQDTLVSLQSGNPGFSSKAQSVGRIAQANAGGLHGTVLAQSAQQAIATLSNSAAMNAPGAIEEFAASCLAARRLFVLGLRSCFALAYSLAYIERFIRPGVVLVADAGGAIIDVLEDAQSDDALCIISQAPYARLALELAGFAHQRKVPLLVITDSPMAPYCNWARQALYFDARTPSFFPSQVGCLMLIEQLALAQLSSSTTDVVKNIDKREQLLQAAGAYVAGNAPSTPSRTRGSVRIRKS